MPERIPEHLLSAVSKTVESILGLNFPPARWHDLSRALTKCAPTLGFDDPHTCVRWLLDVPVNEDRIEALAEYLTIGETHFFRDHKLFRALEDQIFPDLIAARRLDGMNLKIWSAGCATGEEPYSIAILLHRMIPDLNRWKVTILGTDVNRTFLRKAEEGLYTQWSFREVPPDIERTCFRKSGNLSAIDQNIKEMVKFSHLNLAKGVFPNFSNGTDTVDIVFCRNVLMYFTPERQQQVIERFFQCLPEGGWLIVSPTEAPCVEHPKFESVSFDGVLVFRKNSGKPAEPLPFQFPFVVPPVQDAPEPVPEFDPLPWPVPDLDVPGQRSTPRFDSRPEPPASDLSQDKSVPEEGSRYVDGLILYEEGRYPDAVETLLEALRLNHLKPGESVAAMSVLARAYANQGQLSDALEWSEKAVEADRVNPIYHYVHASILQESERIDEAIASLNRAVFLDPKLVVAHFALGNLARGQGRFQVSERHYRSALSALGRYTDDSPVPASEGMTAAKFADLIVAMTSKETRHDNP
jgi:chemotaxis protein methyltransferase CheR